MKERAKKTTVIKIKIVTTMKNKRLTINLKIFINPNLCIRWEKPKGLALPLGLLF